MEMNIAIRCPFLKYIPGHVYSMQRQDCILLSSPDACVLFHLLYVRLRLHFAFHLKCLFPTTSNLHVTKAALRSSGLRIASCLF